MSPPNALRKRGASLLLLCSVYLLIGIAGGIGKSDETAGGRLRIQPQTEYEVVLLTAPSSLTDSVGQGVAAGQAVGTGRIPGSATPDETHAVLWPQGSAVGVDLHPACFRYSAALETDGQRQVGSGNGPPTNFARHALLWRGSANSYVDLHPAGNWSDSVARAIAGDQQVGNTNSYFYTSYERRIVEHAALWRGTAASVVDLHPSAIGCDRSYANDTDGSRQVGYCYFSSPANTAPYRAVLWSGTAASAILLHPNGYTHSFAEGVSGDEQVGYAFNTRGDGYSRALLWRGTAARVVSLHPSDYVTTAAWATNGVMQVGSGSTAATGSQSHALRWLGTADSVLDLHELLPSEFAAGGSIAYAIDASGNIVGLAQRPDGTTAAVLWRRTSKAPTPNHRFSVSPTTTHDHPQGRSFHEHEKINEGRPLCSEQTSTTDQGDARQSDAPSDGDGGQPPPFTDENGRPLTVGGELDKLASNVALGRNFGGVHLRSDGEHGIMLGEEVAIRLLQDHLRTYREKFRCNDNPQGTAPSFKLTKRSGERVMITATSVSTIAAGAAEARLAAEAEPTAEATVDRSFM